MENETTTWGVNRHTFWCTQRTLRNTSWNKHIAISVEGSGFHCCAVFICNMLYDIFPLTREQTQASTRRETLHYIQYRSLACDLRYRATFITLAVGCNQTRPMLRPSHTVHSAPSRTIGGSENPQ